MSILLKRAELHAQVWSKPIGPLSRSLGLTSAKLREACKTLGISLPPLGHWTEVKAEKIPADVPELLAHDGPHELRIGAEKKLQSPADWVGERQVNVVPANNRPAPTRKIAAARADGRALTHQPRFVLLMEWAEARFATPPHKNTLLRWVNEGRIQPQPQKIGRRWYLSPTAEYRAD